MRHKFSILRSGIKTYEAVLIHCLQISLIQDIESFKLVTCFWGTHLFCGMKNEQVPQTWMLIYHDFEYGQCGRYLYIFTLNNVSAFPTCWAAK